MLETLLCCVNMVLKIFKKTPKLTNHSPAAHHCGQNFLEAIALGEELDRELGSEEANKLDGCSLGKSAKGDQC